MGRMYKKKFIIPTTKKLEILFKKLPAKMSGVHDKIHSI